MSKKIGVGDKVGWIHQSKRGPTISFEQRYGVVVGIEDDKVTVRRGKRTVKIPMAMLQVVGTEPSQLQSLVGALAEAYKEKAERAERG